MNRHENYGMAPETAERLRAILLMAPSRYRDEMSAVTWNLDTLDKAGGAETLWAKSVARSGRKVLKDIWTEGIILPLRRTGRNPLHAWLANSLPENMPDRASLIDLRHICDDLDIDLTVRAHVEGIIAFVEAASFFEDAFVSLVTESFVSSQKSWSGLRRKIWSRTETGSPSSAIEAIEPQGRAKWAALLTGPMEALIVPLGRTMEIDVNDLGEFVPNFRDLTLHVAAARDLHRQRYLAINGFRWSALRTEGMMSRPARCLGPA